MVLRHHAHRHARWVTVEREEEEGLLSPELPEVPRIRNSRDSLDWFE